jgi:hypothetical protein
MNNNQILLLRAKETNSQPKEKTEDNPKIFLKFFCFHVVILPINTLSPPKNLNRYNLLKDNKIRGISFCQTERTQINPQSNFWINFKYQNWKGAPPNFNNNAKKKQILKTGVDKTLVHNNLNNIITLPKDWTKK